jgi:hypothetical protein
VHTFVIIHSAYVLNATRPSTLRQMTTESSKMYNRRSCYY